MARTKNNALTRGYRGKFGEQVVLKHYGETSVLSKIPVFTKPWSEKQIANRQRFGKAAREAAILASKPEVRERYTGKLKPMQNVLNLLVSEKMKGGKY